MAETAARDLAGKFIAFLETGAPPDGLFAPDVFCDLPPRGCGSSSRTPAVRC
jgi:hypothetical protein